MATPEFRWPMTTMMALSAMMFFALDTPTSGLAWSSYGTSSTLKPVFSRLPLNFSMASCVPSLMPSPSAAWPPLSGLCVAILIVLPCAAGPDPSGRRAMASAAPSATRLRIRVRFIDSLLERRRIEGLRAAPIIAAACGRSSRSSAPDELEEAPRGGRRIGRGTDGGDDGHTVGARPDDLGHVFVRDAADPHEWNADLAAEFPDQRRPNQLEVRLARRREHRADGDVVGAVVAGGARLLDGVRRHAQQHAAAQQRARGPGGQVLLAQVDAVGFDGHREVHAVVHDEGHAGAPAAVAEPARQGQQPPRGPLLLTELDHPAATVDDGAEEVIEVAPARRRPIEDDVERRVYQGCRRATSAVVKRPSMNLGSLSVLRWKGMVVFTPSITVSWSARRMRSMASVRLRPRTMI